MNIAIIGAGLIGKKRARALPKGVLLKIICDIDSVIGEEFAQEFNCDYEKDWRMVIKNHNIQAVIICVTNNFLAPIAIEAIKNNKHVLIEKPGGVSVIDIQKVLKQYKRTPKVVMFGYNHRFHPSFQRAKQIIDSKKYGTVLFIRAKYGHGGRLGYEKEWRFKKDISGGGELLDQGCHLIDLVNFLAGPMDNLTGFLTTLFWKTKLEDTAFFILKNKKQIAQLSVSCVEWKNIFQFEIMLEKAKIQIDGLGGSYGQEKLTLFKMRSEMGPPDIKELIFPKDNSWETENKLFFKNIKNSNFSADSIEDSLYVMKIIQRLYMNQK